MKPRLLILFVATVLLAGCQRSVEVSGEIFTHQLFKDGNQVSHRMVRQAGTVVYLLSEEENSDFLNRLNQRQAVIDRDYLRDWQQESNRTVLTFLQVSNRVVRVRLAHGGTAGLNSLVNEYRTRFDDPRNDQEILADMIPWMQRNRPSDLAKHSDAVADYDRLKKAESEILREAKIVSIDHPIEFQLNFHKPVAFSLKEKPLADFLANCRKTVADSDGKFKVRVNRGHAYYVVAQGAVARTTPWSINFASWHFRFLADGQKLILSDGNERKEE